MTRPVFKLIVHCSYTPPSMDIGAAEIREWHMSADPADPSKPWRDIGYHYVVRRNGEVEKGRQDAVAGAHTYGHNMDSLGICLVGGMAEEDRMPDCNFTFEQFASLDKLLRSLIRKHPEATITGHRDWARKACPTFDVQGFVSSWLLRNDL